MDKALARYFWVFNLAVLAVLAFLIASGTGEILADGLAGALPAAARKPVSAPSRGVRRPAVALDGERDGTDILSRNIFDSVTGPIGRNGESDEDDDEPVSMDGPLPIVPCGGQYQVLATVASSNNPEWSFASLLQGGKPMLSRIGDAVGDRTISDITWRYVFFRGSSDECYVDLFGDNTGASQPRIAGLTAKGGEDLRGGVQIVSDTERNVDRGLVEKALADPATFARSVRVRPHRENGQVVGFKLRRFKEDSPLAMLGAKKGDVIRAVNGIPLTSVDQALSAYQNLRSANRLTFSITRDGKPMDLNINIK